MLEPCNPNKRVIIMMHGLASSPETWIGLTNDILMTQNFAKTSKFGRFLSNQYPDAGKPPPNLWT